MWIKYCLIKFWDILKWYFNKVVSEICVIKFWDGIVVVKIFFRLIY